MAQLLLMLIHLQQLRKLYKAIQWVTHMPIPRHEYRKCLEYSLTEDSPVIHGEVEGKARGKKKTSWLSDHNVCGCRRIQMGHTVKVMRLSCKH